MNEPIPTWKIVVAAFPAVVTPLLLAVVFGCIGAWNAIDGLSKLVSR